MQEEQYGKERREHSNVERGAQRLHRIRKDTVECKRNHLVQGELRLPGKSLVCHKLHNCLTKSHRADDTADEPCMFAVTAQCKDGFPVHQTEIRPALLNLYIRKCVEKTIVIF